MKDGKDLETKNGAEGKPRRKYAFRKLLPGILLAVVFCAAFLIRASAYLLPAEEPRVFSFFQDEDGEPYLTENDSYYYLRKAREMAEGGGAAWTQNREDDPLIGARTGGGKDGAVQPLGLSVLAWALWRLLSPFGVSLTRTAAWMGPVIGSLAVLPAYFYTRRRTSLAGGLTAALLAAGAIPFVQHTQAGFFDTDMALAVLPTAAVTAQMASLCEPGRGRRLACALLSAAAFAATGLFWRAHSGYLLLSEAALAISAALLLFSRAFPGLAPSRRIRLILRRALPGLLLPAAALLLVRGREGLAELLRAPAAFRAAAGSADAMPYALEHIAEMQPLPFLPKGGLRKLILPGTDSLLGRAGGLIPFALAVYWFPLSWARAAATRRGAEDETLRREAAYARTETVYFSLWLTAGILLGLRAVRFAEITALPVCLLCGLTVGELYRLAGRAQGRRRTAARALCAALALAAALPACRTGVKNLRSSAPSTLINDSKAEALGWVREHTPENTVAASWWDDGYYLQYRGDRRTLGDGGSDSGARSWFLAKALLAEDPRLAAGIFRMLGESGTDALDRLTEAGMDQARAAGLLLRILPLSRDEAGAVFREEGAPAAVLDETHPVDPDPAALVLSTDILQRYTSLGYFGFWNPETRAQEERAFTLSSSASAAAENGEALIPMTDGRYTVRIREGEYGHIEAEYTLKGETRAFSRLCVWENGKRIRDERRENDGLAAVLLREKGRYCAFLCSENLCDSLLVRLLVCEDASVEGFEKLGTWYADTAGEESLAQLRIGYARKAGWAAQVWRIHGTGEEAGPADE